LPLGEKKLGQGRRAQGRPNDTQGCNGKEHYLDRGKTEERKCTVPSWEKLKRERGYGKLNQYKSKGGGGKRKVLKKLQLRKKTG